MEPQIAEGLPWLGINSSGININNSSIQSDDGSLGDSPLSMLAAAATAAAAADAAASAAAAAAAAASATAAASSVVSKLDAGIGGRAVEGMHVQQMVSGELQGGNASSGSGRQREREGDSSAESSEFGQAEGAENDASSLLESWCENP
jgi:hypothetical protein